MLHGSPSDTAGACAGGTRAATRVMTADGATRATDDAASLHVSGTSSYVTIDGSSDLAKPASFTFECFLKLDEGDAAYPKRIAYRQLHGVYPLWDQEIE